MAGRDVGAAGFGLKDADWPAAALLEFEFEFALALLVGLLGVESWFFRFRRDACSFSAFSMTTLAIRSNSEQTPSIR